MKRKEQVTIGFLGFGTVGSGAVRILQENKSEITRRIDFELRLKTICSRTITTRDTSWVDSRVIRTVDPLSIINDPEIDIVIEVMGGMEPARTFILQAISNGKFVVTANKLLLAAAGPELSGKASARGVSMGIEAAVAGGIPVLNAIREGLAGERLESIRAILNGTTNFILTEMEKTNRPFGEILEIAQNIAGSALTAKIFNNSDHGSGAELPHCRLIRKNTRSPPRIT